MTPFLDPFIRPKPTTRPYRTGVGHWAVPPLRSVEPGYPEKDTRSLYSHTLTCNSSCLILDVYTSSEVFNELLNHHNRRSSHSKCQQSCENYSAAATLLLQGLLDRAPEARRIIHPGEAGLFDTLTTMTLGIGVHRYMGGSRVESVALSTDRTAEHLLASIPQRLRKVPRRSSYIAVTAHDLSNPSVGLLADRLYPRISRLLGFHLEDIRSTALDLSL